jgi:hypothetical protein
MMTRSMSRSAIAVKLELYEIEVLFEWHRDQQWHTSEKKQYQDAANHQSRAADLMQQITDRKAELAAEQPSVSSEG